MNNYSDIINLPYKPYARKISLSPQQRAAQFMPFAALTGYEECIIEKARLMEKKALERDDDWGEFDV